MGIVNGNPMGMEIRMVGEWEWEWEWEWLYGNGREWESERHSRTPLVSRTKMVVVRSASSDSTMIVYWFCGFFVTSRALCCHCQMSFPVQRPPQVVIDGQRPTSYGISHSQETFL